MIPAWWENGTPFFYTSQIDDYGLPELFGYSEYMVVDDTTTHFVLDYEMEQERRLRPVHRYNRSERFNYILGQLMGYRGELDDDTLDTIISLAQEPYTWESIRTSMKNQNLAKFYNRIPYVLRYLRKDRLVQITDKQTYQKVVNDFKTIETAFNENKGYLGRKYFPSLRFIALKLLQRHGAVVDIPLMRNKKTLEQMQDLWTLLELV